MVAPIKQIVPILIFVSGACAFGTCFGGVLPQPTESRSNPPTYGSRDFKRLVVESYSGFGETAGERFSQWWDRRLRQVTQLSAQGWIERARKRLSQSHDSPSEQLALGEELHRIVKKAIPKFSLDRGFEFRNAVKFGERQCLLQSVLTASMLQSAGAPCGISMVWSNERGETSNLGHVVAIQLLSNGKGVLVDASEPCAHPHHVGLFLWNSKHRSYQFVRPHYDSTGKFDVVDSTDSKSESIRDLQTLDLGYVRSMFAYYRGERTPSGLLSKTKTSQGLKRSEKFFRISLRECSSNSLSAFSLGRVLLMENRVKEASDEFRAALALYHSYGWVPQSVKDATRSTR